MLHQPLWGIYLLLLWKTGNILVGPLCPSQPTNSLKKKNHWQIRGCWFSYLSAHSFDLHSLDTFRPARFHFLLRLSPGPGALHPVLEEPHLSESLCVQCVSWGSSSGHFLKGKLEARICSPFPLQKYSLQRGHQHVGRGSSSASACLVCGWDYPAGLSPCADSLGVSFREDWGGGGSLGLCVRSMPLSNISSWFGPRLHFVSGRAL